MLAAGTREAAKIVVHRSLYRDVQARERTGSDRRYIRTHRLRVDPRRGAYFGHVVAMRCRRMDHGARIPRNQIGRSQLRFPPLSPSQSGDDLARDLGGLERSDRVGPGADPVDWGLETLPGIFPSEASRQV